jgi:uncharacterized membrane protein YkvA (DUF1232 family)
VPHQLEFAESRNGGQRIAGMQFEYEELEDVVIVSRIEAWKQRIEHLKTETYAVYLASKDPRVPWYAKALVAFVVAHTFSPIDLIPDFIPVLGIVDDLVITPLGIALALKMIPEQVMLECRLKAQEKMLSGKPTSKLGAAMVVIIWLLLASVLIVAGVRVLDRR